MILYPFTLQLQGCPLLKPYALAQTPCLVKTGADTIAVAAGTRVIINGSTLITFAAQTAATLDTGALVAGTDYAVYATAAGTAVFSANFSAPTGYTTANSQLIGGFHYAPGGNATAQAGGDTTPAINQYSIWDLKFRPRCPDPRGMAIVADGFWVDIYLLNTDPDVNGTSKNNTTIADGASAPKIPALFGGNGTTTYGTLTWFEAVEIAAAYGKRLPAYAEMCAAAYGTTEATDRGTDAFTTGLGTTNAGTRADQTKTSKWGLIQATGTMWVWLRDLGFIPHTTALTGTPPAAADLETWINAAKTGSYKAITESRGSVYTYGNNGLAAGLHGGNWYNGSFAGSRASYWNSAPSNSNGNVGARFACDHLVLP